MMSFRSFSRAVSRPASQLSSRYVSRQFSAAPRIALPRYQPLRVLLRPSCAPFSTTRAAFEKEGQVDQELSAKIESELQMEQEIRDSEELPESLQDFINNGSFKLHDTPGQEEVVLTRKFGDEDIRITFTIADLNAGIDQDDDFDDKALYDEADPSDAVTDSTDPTTATPRARKPASSSTAAESAGDEDVDLTDDAQQDPSFPVRIAVQITKKVRKGWALHIDTTAQDGEIVIDNVSYLPDPVPAQPQQGARQATTTYAGPPFGNLDEDLQVLLERYLDERGVNAALAVWAVEYIDFKEQREYLRWLNGVKGFVDA